MQSRLHVAYWGGTALRMQTRCGRTRACGAPTVISYLLQWRISNELPSFFCSGQEPPSRRRRRRRHSRNSDTALWWSTREEKDKEAYVKAEENKENAEICRNRENQAADIRGESAFFFSSLLFSSFFFPDGEEWWCLRPRFSLPSFAWFYLIVRACVSFAVDFFFLPARRRSGFPGFASRLRH